MTFLHKYRFELMLVIMTAVLVAMITARITSAKDARRAAEALETVGLERAQAVDEVEELSGLLASKGHELEETLGKLEQLETSLVVASRADFTVETTVPEGPVTAGRKPPTETSCLDWLDEHGRFHFHQDTRSLDVTMRFRLQTLLAQTPFGDVAARSVVHEISPKTGEELGTVPVEQETAYFRVPERALKKYRVSFGAEVTEEDLTPYLRLERQFPYRLVTGLHLSRDPSIFAGFAFEWGR